MQDIGSFIIENANKNLKHSLHISVIQIGEEIGMSLDEMCDELFDTIDIYNVDKLIIFAKNVGIQRSTLISFEMEGIKCEIGEHFDTQRDYFWVRMSPIG